MTLQEIRKKIDEIKEDNNTIILEGLHVLNTKIETNIKKIEELQNQCEHYYQDGVCIYCDKEAME